MLKFKIITAVVRALSTVAAATKASSDGGKAITSGERDEIIGAVLESVIDLLDPLVSDDDAGK